MNNQLYLHNLPVEFLGVGPFGIRLRDGSGNVEWVFATGKAAVACLTDQPQDPPSTDCRNCSWEAPRWP